MYPDYRRDDCPSALCWTMWMQYFCCLVASYIGHYILEIGSIGHPKSDQTIIIFIWISLIKPVIVQSHPRLWSASLVGTVQFLCIKIIVLLYSYFVTLWGVHLLLKSWGDIDASKMKVRISVVPHATFLMIPKSWGCIKFRGNKISYLLVRN